MVTRRDFLKTMSMASAGWHWEPVIYYMRKLLHLKKEEVTK